MKPILLIILMSTLAAACTTKMPLTPTKPTLDIIRRDDGGICLDRADAAELGVYITDLEQAVQACLSQ